VASRVLLGVVTADVSGLEIFIAGARYQNWTSESLLDVQCSCSGHATKERFKSPLTGTSAIPSTTLSANSGEIDLYKTALQGFGGCPQVDPEEGSDLAPLSTSLATLTSSLLVLLPSHKF